MTLPRTISFSYFENTFMIVPVRINENIYKDFIFDTGIGVNVISKALCQQFDCKAMRVHSGKRMSGQEVHIPISSVASLSFGGHEAKDVPVGILDLEAMMPGAKIGGFLSLGFFRDLPYSVDYVHREIKFEDAKSLEQIRTDGVRVPVKLDMQGPSFGIFMPLVLPNGQQISVEVDTLALFILSDLFISKR